MDDNGTAEHTLGANQFDLLICDATSGIALAVGLEITKVANVALAI